jgi:hypothetical protein
MSAANLQLGGLEGLPIQKLFFKPFYLQIP